MTLSPSFHNNILTLNRNLDAVCVAKDNELNQLEIVYKDHVKINTIVVKPALELVHLFIYLQLYLYHDRHKTKLLMEVKVAIAWKRESKARSTF